MEAKAALPVKVEVSEGLAHVTLDRPAAANSLSCELVGALGHALARLRGEEGEGVRAVILTGAGEKAFCAGADLKERRKMTLEETRSFLKHLNQVVDAIAAFPRPVIAAINGAAFGGGLELALACDFRLAAAHAELGLVETRLGIIPGAGGTQRLARVVGLAAAKELILTGRRIDAARALELGIVSSAIDGGFDLPIAEALKHERACYEVVLASEDRNEGLAAFAEKRPPNFTGK